MSINKLLAGTSTTPGVSNGYLVADAVNALIDSVSTLDSAGTAKNVALVPANNFIDPEVGGSTITGVGWNVFPNKIGFVAKPLGPDGTNAAEWTLDSGYASATVNDASVAAILGGYDHVNNQIAGTICGGGHNFIQYDAGGHSLIGGGSYNWISAGRATILAGTNNRIAGDTYNNILGGFTNKILAGGHNVIVGGELNTINNPSNKFCYAYGQNVNITGTSRYTTIIGLGSTASNAVRSAIIGGQSHTMNGTTGSATIAGNTNGQTNTTNCFIGGGENSSMVGNSYAGSVGGQGNTQTGRSSFMACAENSNDNGARGLFTGRRAQGLGAHFQATIGCNHPTTGVLCQSMVVAQGVTTTGTNLNAPTDQIIAVGNTGTTTICGSVHVVGRNTTDGKTAGYKVDFVAQWDGVNFFLNGANADLAIPVIYEDATSNITPPILAFNLGQLRVRFGGTASKTINWSATFNITVLRA